MPLIGYGHRTVGHDTEGGIASHPASNGERTIDDVQIGKHRKRRDGTVRMAVEIGDSHREGSVIVGRIERSECVVVVGCARYRTTASSYPLIRQRSGAERL